VLRCAALCCACRCLLSAAALRGWSTSR
jgi:hypothetical protein